jgi:hypothetical protein
VWRTTRASMCTRPTQFQEIGQCYPGFIADLLGCGRRSYAGSFSLGCQPRSRGRRSRIMIWGVARQIVSAPTFASSGYRRARFDISVRLCVIRELFLSCPYPCHRSFRSFPPVSGPSSDTQLGWGGCWVSRTLYLSCADDETYPLCAWDTCLSYL